MSPQVTNELECRKIETFCGKKCSYGKIICFFIGKTATTLPQPYIMNNPHSNSLNSSFLTFWQSPLAYSLSVALLVAMHIAGLVGLAWPVTKSLFLALIPFHLITTAVVVLLLHSVFDRSFFLFCLIAFGVGFGIEVLGVKTGQIFGSYHYGPSLGWKLWEVPLVIGCNWLTLIYCTGIMAEKWLKVNVLKPILGALLMVAIDVWIEPVAIHLDFWQWQNNLVPLQNYIGWFVVSLVLQVCFRYLVTAKHNPMATVVYLTQFVFFMGFHLLLYWY